MLYIWPWQAPELPPRAVDLLHDHRGLGQAQARAAVLLRDQRGQPAGLGERVDERLGVGALRVDLAVVLVGKLRRTARAPRRGCPGDCRSVFIDMRGRCLRRVRRVACIASQPSWSRAHSARAALAVEPAADVEGMDVEQRPHRP